MDRHASGPVPRGSASGVARADRRWGRARSISAGVPEPGRRLQDYRRSSEGPAGLPPAQRGSTRRACGSQARRAIYGDEGDPDRQDRADRRAKYGEQAPLATACRTCVQTNLLSLAVASPAFVVAPVRRHLKAALVDRQFAVTPSDAECRSRRRTFVRRAMCSRVASDAEERIGKVVVRPAARNVSDVELPARRNPRSAFEACAAT